MARHTHDFVKRSAGRLCSANVPDQHGLVTRKAPFGNVNIGQWSAPGTVALDDVFDNRTRSGCLVAIDLRSNDGTVPAG
jgi:hypothetical protein